MPLRTLKTDEVKLLKAYAARMPVVMHNTHEVHIMTGAELLEMGYVEHEGEKLIPAKKYHFNTPVQLAANHFRRLKRAWLKDGESGIRKYIFEISDLIHKNKKAQNA